MKDNRRRLIHTSAQFVAGFVPPDYFLEGILQRGFIYSLTGRTGSGKTAIMLLIAALSATNKGLRERELEWGRILYLAGENPDDIRMRWIAMSDHMGFDVDRIEVNFVIGRGPGFSDVIDTITEEVEAMDGVAMIIVDTSRAAMISINCEQMESEGAAGQRIDLDLFGKLTDRLGRVLQRLGIKRTPRDITPSVSEYLEHVTTHDT